MENERVRTGVAFDSERLKAAKQVAKERFGGNMSALIDAALEPYISEGASTPTATNPNCLIELTKAYCPARVPQMVEFCENGGKPLNQPIALENILKLIATGNIGISQEFLLAAESAPVYNQRKKPTEK